MAANTEAKVRKGKIVMETEPFLVACFKNQKEKPTIDYDALAKETGMTTKGAA